MCPHGSLLLMTIYKKPTLLMMAGHAGTGKTTFSHLFMAHESQAGRAWAFLDKDTIGGLFAKALMTAYTGDGDDRDSPAFAEKVRPLEYQALTDVALENLSMGQSCIACAPFGRECKTREAFDAYAQTFSHVARVILLWNHVSPDSARQRIIARGHPMDKYKLEHWDAYMARRYEPDWVHQHPNALWLDSDGKEQTTALRWLAQNT